MTRYSIDEIRPYIGKINVALNTNDKDKMYDIWRELDVIYGGIIPQILE